jgi:MoxR-like ATPase
VREVVFKTIDELEAGLRSARYLPERGLATALYLSLALEKPLLLEGEAGVGKTEAAKALAEATSSRLIRLQCYEGLDVAHAVYEWNYSRQLLHIRAAQEGTVSEQELFGPEFLIRRPLLEAIESEEPVVLLIDEIDRADDEFEAFLLEMLSDFQITIPEIGTVTSNVRSRSLSCECPVFPTGSQGRPQHSCKVCGGWISRSRRAWPRRSTGRKRLPHWGVRSSTPGSSKRRSALS